ncbi:hypothetical protein UY3_04166 [Chelonia mydas]|uniref:Uncharacterized protein n=1 Tax=Chelonia mydas TaxID=8469 RepID=M7BS57_CHEMY|nr:hypothetical protein UY3_04166 [Chelonia mydas]
MQNLTTSSKTSAFLYKGSDLANTYTTAWAALWPPAPFGQHGGMVDSGMQNFTRKPQHFCV